MELRGVDPSVYERASHDVESVPDCAFDAPFYSSLKKEVVDFLSAEGPLLVFLTGPPGMSTRP